MIEVYFDYLSPYAYLAWQALPAVAERLGRPIVPRPTLFAGLLNAFGQKGPAEIPPKRIYTFKHCWRLAADLGVHFAAPPSHPFNPLLALRVTLAIEDAELQRQVIDRLFAAVWGGGAGAETPQQIVPLLSAAGLDAQAVLAAATSEPIKAKLRQGTADAVAKGVFGVPTFIVDNELFWGLDSLSHLEAFVEGRDPVDRQALAQLVNLPSSAQRR